MLILCADKLRAYSQGISQVFQGAKPEHIANCGINKPHASNNRIERLNGTLRERVKVQRGWKSMETPIAEGQRVQYDFVKLHAALNGETPAQKAGIDIIEGKDKWLNLMKKALSVKQSVQQ